MRETYDLAWQMYGAGHSRAQRVSRDSAPAAEAMTLVNDGGLGWHQ
jgi:hypothetical protein